MHQELALQYIRPKNPRPFSQDREAWLTMAVIFLPLFAGFVMMLWTPMKPPPYPFIYQYSDRSAGKMMPPYIKIYGVDMYPIRYSLRDLSRHVSFAAGVAVAVAMAFWRGNKFHRMRDDQDLQSLPIAMDRLIYFAVTDRIRAYAMLGVVTSITLLLTSAIMVPSLMNSTAWWDVDQVQIMMNDIYGSSAHFMSWRYGRAFLYCWIFYTCTLLLKSRISRSKAIWAVMAIVSLGWLHSELPRPFWMSGVRNPVYLYFSVALLFAVLAANALKTFSTEEPPPTTRRRVKLFRWVLRQLA